MKKFRLSVEKIFVFFLHHLKDALSPKTVIALLVVLNAFQLQANPGISTEQLPVSIVKEAVRVKEVLKDIEKQTHLRFFYSNQQVDVKRIISVRFDNLPLKDAISVIFSGTAVNFRISNDQILLWTFDVKGASTEDLSGASSNSNSSEEIAEALVTRITGIIRNESGEGLPGVSIIIKGTTIGTITNDKGEFQLDASPDAILQISSVGYVPIEITVGNQTFFDLKMEVDVVQLSEVVVTALGIVKESRKLGYAASSVQVDEITQNRTTNVMKSLEGKIAGLEIAPPTAGAGASTRIRLRGQSGFAGQVNSPLIVINGLPMDQDARSAEGAPGIDQGDNLQQINQDDIESMTVLKGATAAALYGSRASNGAIIITTKSGAKNSKFGVEFTSNFAADEVRDFSNFQTVYGNGIGGNRPTTQAEAIASGNQSWGAKLDGEPTIQYDGISRPYSADKNRIKEFYRTGISTMNTIALAGGNASTSYRASFSNQDVKGITPDNSYHKKIFNLGLNSNVTDKLKLHVNINYTNEENNNPPIVGVQGVSYTSFLTRMPLTLSNSTLKTSVVDSEGAALNIFNSLLVNPYFFIGRMFNYTTRDRVLGTVSVRYDFTKWLYLQGRVNVDFGYSNNEFNFPHGAGVPLRNSTNTGWRGTYDVNTSFNRQINSDFLLGTTHKIGDFTIDGSFGGNIWTVNNKNTSQGVTDFVVRDRYSIGNGITKTQDYGISRWQVNSLYALADFGYKDFLYLNLTDRIDYFSVLTPPSSIVANPKNSFNYYSVGASFIFSELLPNISWLDYGKLRGTYATSGNANGVDPFSSQLTYAIEQQLFGTYPIGTIAPNGTDPNGTNPNPSLEPAGVSEKEIGLELKTLNSRLNFDIAVYDKRTSGQILPVDLSPFSGYGSTLRNVAKLKNTGLEVMIDGTPVRTSNFSWNISANAAYNTSKVLALNPGQSRQLVVYFNGTGNEFLGSLVYDVGKEMNQLISYTYRRNDEGRIMLNSQGRLLQSETQVNYGSANAKVTGGITNIFQYKNLSLLIHVDGKFGGKLFSGTALNGLRFGMSQASLVGRDGVVFDGVLPDGTENTISVDPKVFYADYRTLQIADPFVFRSDFIKLRNITLTYDLTSFITKNVKFVKGLTLSVYCRNAALLLKYVPDVDPEAFASSSDSRLGYEQHTEPTTRTWGLNLNAKF
jgi:TonB-linked SusC/RagA family outer membrane protein